MNRAIAALLTSTALALPAAAQETVWVQLEARETLSGATSAAREYADDLENVAGFSLGSRWYGVALGPYTPEDARNLLSRLKSQGVVPGDAYIADGSTYGNQFWPVGAAAATSAQPLPGNEPAAQVEETAAEPAEEATETAEAEQSAQQPAEAPSGPPVPDETVQEARASERDLTREEKMDLQVALKWAGHYEGPIDAAFGSGTRSSMRSWQEANGREVTGVMTTGQRADLFEAYNAILDGLGLRLVRDETAGIAMQIPTGAVEFTEYQPPFAKFEAQNPEELPARVFLISESGDQDRLYGLYEILQTLAIVPPEGDRSRQGNSFTIEGRNGEIHSYTEAGLANGRIKGFTLVWPAGDEERRTRVLGEMRESFSRIDGVLDPAAHEPDEDQAADLVSGLEVRKPHLSRSGFYIDGAGRVLTTTEVVEECSDITVDGTHSATVEYRDPALGIAVLNPEDDLAPLDVAEFQTGVPRLETKVAVAGYPYGGVLSSASMTFGTLADLRGLDGNEAMERLALSAEPGNAGGPLFDRGGAVLGMLLPKQEQNGQVLPGDVSFAADAKAILGSLDGSGITPRTTGRRGVMEAETLTMKAADMTVLVSCW